MLKSFSKALLHNRRKRDELFNPAAVILTLGLLLLANSYSSSTINLLSVPIIYCAYIVICYSDSLLKCISIAVCFYMLAMAPEFIVSTIFSLNCYHDAETALGNELSGLCLTLIAKIITFIIVKCVEQIHKRHEYEEVNNGIFCSLLVLPIATMTLLIALFYADIHIPVNNKLFLEIGTGMLLFANAFMFYLFDKLIETMEKAYKMERLYVKSETENKHYQQLERINDKHRALMHDIKKYIRTAAELIQNNENVSALQIFEKLDIEIRNTSASTIDYCTNKLLNAILCERKTKANELGIEYKVNLSLDLYTEYIDDIDLISIVGNLIDNAIEAAAKLKDKGFVNIEMFMANEGHFMVWEVSNNFLIPPVVENGGFITSKRNMSEHGIGIHTVEKIVKSYGGTLKIDIDNKVFIASIIFQVDKSGL
jgi:sensor histidine kinase YesM